MSIDQEGSNADESKVDPTPEEANSEEQEAGLEAVPFEEGHSSKEIGGVKHTSPEEFEKAIYDVPVKVRVVLGQTKMPVKNLVALKRGEVVQLDKRAGDSVDIWVNDCLIARGEVVLVDGVLGVTLTELVQESLVS